MEHSLQAVLSNLAGLVVVLTKKDGSVYEGILDPDTLHSKHSITLSLVCQLSPQQRVLTTPKLVVNKSDILSVRCDSLTLTSSTTASVGFQTDSSISSKSSNAVGGKRQLQAWVPDSADPSIELSADNSSTNGKQWDQFAANERLFGVKTDFDESAYTTSINLKDPRFAERAAKAEKLAKEISSTAKSTLNPHLIEERSGVLREGDEDEEDLYGAVLRDDNGAPPGFSLPDQNPDQDDDVVKLPSQFEADRLKISREFTALQEELAKDTVIEVPQSIKSKLNPTAEAFIPSASVEEVIEQHAYYQPQPYNYYQPAQPYYYYDEYGNCYYYDPSQTQYY